MITAPITLSTMFNILLVLVPTFVVIPSFIFTRIFSCHPLCIGLPYPTAKVRLTNEDVLPMTLT